MPVRGVTLCIPLLLLVVGCSDNEPAAAPTSTTVDETTTSSTAPSAPEREPSTTTTAFDPASVEGAVEAAYLKSWDVYADAVYDLQLDEEALAEVYAEDHLEAITDEVTRRIDEERAALVIVEHDYTIQLEGATTAHVVDRYQNHQVLIDPETKEPIEDDPDEELIDLVTLTELHGSWRVTRIERLQ